MKLLKRIFSRQVYVGLLIVIQLAAITLLVLRLNERFTYLYSLFELIAAVLVIHIVSRTGNAAYKIAWIIPMLSLPLFTIPFYFVFGKNRLSKREVRRMHEVSVRYAAAMMSAESAEDKLKREAPDAAPYCAYLQNAAHTPVFANTETAYLPDGEAMFAALLAALESAERFIFLEYYKINKGVMWGRVLDVLKRKAALGVDVRVIYDDFGCAYGLPDGYEKQLAQMGIRAHVFNPFLPVLSIRFNNRDHRKICVVDGNVGFMGGINLADNYINVTSQYGHWSDSAVRLTGDAVFALSSMFLSMWDYLDHVDSDFLSYRPTACNHAARGFVQPFTDTPLDGEPTGHRAYLSILNRAKRYVYINSPYLVVDDEMASALVLAAMSGVDVRIVTPAVCDGKLVQELTRSYYRQFIDAGVRIYEYSPGMMHAKTFLSDDVVGMVGSINLDYRSLFLHFECAAWMYDTAAIAEMKACFLDELIRCEEITPAFCARVSRLRNALRSLLRVFAPLF